MDALMQSSNPLRRTSNSWINLPIPFISGSFEGQTIRAELTEIQKADLGRKYARVDRRPLDPPPVVLLRLFQVCNQGTPAEYEREIHDYSDIHTLGLLCNAGLFPVPPGAREPYSQAQGHTQQQSHAALHSTSETSRAFSYNPQLDLSAVQLPPLTLPTRSVAPQNPQLHPTRRILTYFGGQPITEDMNCTTALSGATFIQPATIEYQGKKALVFTFADLAVKNEGQFFLRYRCFDIFSRSAVHGDLLIQAECYGGPFRIYSTKEFPGLQPSTELTKQLARWGVRLNTRETERKRKRKDDDRSSNSVSRSAQTRESKGSESDYD